MKLSSVKVEGYRSIVVPLNAKIESNVTVILGPNDHGKTNLLNAILHLNDDAPFDGERDLNWDRSDQAHRLPRVEAAFELTREEREFLLSSENSARETVRTRREALIARRAEREAAAKDEAGDEDPAEDSEAAEGEEGEPEAEAGAETEEADEAEADGDEATDEPDDEAEADGDEATDEPDDEAEAQEQALEEVREPLKLEDVPMTLIVSREGVAGSLDYGALGKFSADVGEQFVTRFMPRFELIAPTASLSDSVNAKDLANNEFMRGIFHYAGLDPDNAASLFEQNDQTQMALSNAETLLNEMLRQSWSQGAKLNFKLSHNSKSGSIELQIQDPAVKKRYVRASRRSNGFTHYFALKTQLHARQCDHPANSHVFMFDEPGVFLHPSGQHDLMQVLETLAVESQLLYVTHSLFMLNKTFPTRHRLLQKGDSGTILDGKPYVGRWEAALSTLGISLTGSILFANHVLVTEGDSDPIYLYAVLQASAANGAHDYDLNGLSIIASQDAQHADVLIRLLCETAPRPQMAVLVDGDKGGTERAQYLKELLEAENIPLHQLPKGNHIEDLLPLVREIYLPAFASYASRVAKPGQVDEQKFLSLLLEKFDAGQSDPVVDWTLEAFRELVSNKKADLSKVGIAREYCQRLLALEGGVAIGSQTQSLIDAIGHKTKLRGRTLSKDERAVVQGA